MSEYYTITFEEAGHIYRVNGAVVPSVTQVMQAAGMMDWTKNIHEYFAERGTRVHQACHIFDTAGLDMDSVDDRIKPYVNAYIQFRADTKAKVVASEKVMYSPKLNVCGTLDKLLAWDGKLRLIDLKCSQLPVTAEVQLAAYENIYKEDATRPEIDEVRALVLKEDGKYSLSKPLKTKNGFRVFQAALTITKWKETIR